MKTRIIIAGSRHLEGPRIVDAVLGLFQEAGRNHSTNYEIEIVSGGARGVDYIGEKIAKLFDFPLRRFPAEWQKYGPAAGPMRNRIMAAYAHVLVLVWDGKSKGSKSMLNEAEDAGIPIYSLNVTKAQELPL